MGHDPFAATAILAAAAAFLVWLMQRIGQSAVVAYLLLGVAAGPSGLHLVSAGAEAQHLSEIGVVFLLFFIGLEFHTDALKRTAPLVFGGTAAQIFACGAPVYAVAVALGSDWKEALVLALCTSLSSTAIVVKAFEDRREGDSPAAQQSLAILIGQDFVALAAVAALPALFGGAPAAGERGPGEKFLIMAVALPVLFVVARRSFPFVFRRAAVAQNQEAFALCSLGACLLVAVAAQKLYASLGLGAFLGGLVFAGTPYAHQIRADLAAFKNLAMGFFFFTVGALLDLKFAASHPALVVGSLLALMALKAVLVALVLRVFGSPWSVASAAGLALCQVSEFAFVLASDAAKLNGLGEDRRQLLLSVAVLSMLLAPSLVARANAAGRRLSRVMRGDVRSPVRAPSSAAMTPPAEPAEAESTVTGAETVRAVVVGYGPVGRVLCKILIRFGVSPCVVDLQLDTVKKLHAINREAVYGDAGKREVLEAAGVQRARYLLITLPDLASRAPIITSARALNPQIAIVSRARYLTERSALEQSGADHISYEEAEVAAELARLLLTQLGAREDLLQHEVKKLRSEIAVRTGFTQIFRRPVDAPAGQTEMWSLAKIEDAKRALREGRKDGKPES